MPNIFRTNISSTVSSLKLIQCSVCVNVFQQGIFYYLKPIYCTCLISQKCMLYKEFFSYTTVCHLRAVSGLHIAAKQKNFNIEKNFPLPEQKCDNKVSENITV